MKMLSNKLRVAIRTSDKRQYHLAREIDVHPSLVSCWLNDITPVRAGDPRIVALGRLVGVRAADCFRTDK